MKKIGVINEHNFSKEKIDKLSIRKKVRGLIYKNKNTLVCIEENGYGVKHLLKLPRGSVEKNESNIKAHNDSSLRDIMVFNNLNRI